jgi:glycosyltransferase involved in cell wall biosynthesis
MTQVLKAAARLSARRCACVIATSEDMKRWWVRTGTPLSRIALIPHGIDTEQFRPVPEARALLGIPEDKQIVLYVGRLSHEKGLQYLVEAISTVRIHLPDVQLHLVGDGGFKRHLAQLARQWQIEEQVIFHGWVNQPDLPLYYSAANVTVLPSLSEGLPRTMIEAMACGSPFVGTRITGIVDHVRDGETGLLVNAGDSAELAEKILLLRDSSSAQEMGTAAMQYVHQHLAWGVIVPRMRSEVYERITQERTRSA